MICGIIVSVITKGGNIMGTIMVGRNSYYTDRLEVVDNKLLLDSHVIDLYEECVIQISSIENIQVNYIKTVNDAVVCGNIESVCSYGNICLVGLCGGIYAENCRFNNATGYEYYKKARNNCKSRSKYGKRTIVKLTGKFDSICVKNSIFPVEILLTGNVGKINCNDLYCKGRILSGRCSSNLYYSRFAS